MMYEVNRISVIMLLFYFLVVTMYQYSCQSKINKDKPSIETRIQWFKVLFVIWLLSLFLS